ncbi:LPPG:FO 2-phospho-L-lactate transferase [Afipia massiliensis]|uniref:LPPG:FO 2-phospho-L-lactate transferase n=1 Tax=Afipia massiliensis TaxID=211460 RepID=A0A840N571_9BRAD|nr:2-phospho-L-lactate transferase [Afipia massiliensis]MBB5055203.1 LPPG:FO 2-phospho-L-lactate transferase [Afipia massiliensis]
MSGSGGRIIALAGGVGGAKLADGLAQRLGEYLTVVVNTGDDFEHLGMHVSPDLDTVMYTLAGLANPSQGWGLEGESWVFMDQLSRLGGPDWFKLGDRDLATHAIRTSRLRGGATLSDVTEDLCGVLGIRSRILPMSDDSVRTMIQSDGKILGFQEYFVRLRCEVPVTSICFEGADRAKLNPRITKLHASERPAAVVICPSNPYLSIDPIMAVPGAREWLASLRVPVVAVSPIVAGSAIKGPAAKVMGELGIQVSASAIARHYRGVVSGLVIDVSDAALSNEIESMGLPVRVAQTVMSSAADRLALADECLEFARGLAGRALEDSGR